VSTSQDNWQIVDAGPFSLRLPPEYRREQVQGIDSLVGRWESSPRHLVAFDWGPYSNDLRQARALLRDVVECSEVIDGYGARVVMGLDSEGYWESRTRIRKYVVTASWREIGPLTLTATGSSASEAPTLLAIIRSVAFEKR